MTIPAIVRMDNFAIRVNNFNLVKTLSQALSGGDHAFNTVPPILEEVLETKAWAARTDPHSGATYDVKPHEFRRKFIYPPFPQGLGVTDELIRQFLKSPRLIQLYNDATVSERGGLQHDSRGPDGQFEAHNPNIVRVVDGSPETIPIRPRDRSDEPKAGNSVGYFLRRLDREGRDNPEIRALHERVLAGELSAHAAAVLAGFIEKAISIPAEPTAAARRLLRHFQGDRLAQLIHELQVRSQAEPH